MPHGERASRGKAVAGETILIIDDNADVRTLLGERVLPSYGYRTLVAPDGQEGLWQIRTHNPDLILLDLRLPDMTGIDLLHILAAEGYDIPVILITAYGSELIAAQALRLGVHDYIIKPFTLDEIVESVERALMTLRLRHERNTLTERLRLCTAALQILADLPEELAAIADPDRQVGRLLELLLAASRARSGRVWLRGEDGDLRLQAVQARSDAHVSLLHQRVDMPSQVEMSLSSGVLQQWEVPCEGGGQQVGLALPIAASGGGVVGVLEVNLDRGDMPPDDILVSLLRAFAAHLGALLEETTMRRRLAALERQNKALQALSRDVLIVVDERDAIVSVTPNIAALSGHRPEALIGMDLRWWMEQVAAQTDLIDWYRRQLEQGRDRERYMFMFRGPQGEERLAEVQVLAQGEGRALRRYLLLHEETAYNRLEQEVRLLRRTLGDLVHGSGVGLFLTDLKGTILGANAMAGTLVQLAPEQILGQPLWEAFATAQGSHLLPEEIARAYRQGSGYVEIRWPERAGQVWGLTPLLLVGAGGAPYAIAVLAGPVPAPSAG